jgi:meso-butanediol dehydrogenase / (S,S)-butanediol dehydrogenase / diacetyl reductase
MFSALRMVVVDRRQPQRALYGIRVTGWPQYQQRWSTALPHLLATGGNIVNVASIAGVEGEVYSAGYCAAKHGLIGLTRALAVEFTNEKLRVNAVCPGGMPTAQATEFEAPENADWDLILRIASPRDFMETVDVAKTIAFLASDDAAAIHGAVYRVDNGNGAG